ncbi:MAG: cytochrome P450 [Silvibacterium sp.]|nr:cytochrome P450 [Silvibacterium sp.]MBV8437808.1 cytochrome P450 [Silvibacterium sp.]
MLQRTSDIQAETRRHGPVLAAPLPPAAPLPILKYICAARRNAVAAFHADVYREWIVETKLWKLHTFIVNDPAGIRRVLIDNADNYIKGTIEPRIASASSRADFIANNKWRDRRRTMSSALNHRCMFGNAAMVFDSTQALLEEWKPLAAHLVFDISSEMARLALGIMSQVVFSSDRAESMPVLEHALARVHAEPLVNLLDFAPLLSRPWAAYKRNCAHRAFSRLTAFIHEVIRKRSVANADYDDLLGRLMQERNAETAHSLSTEEIQTQIVTVIGAGQQSIGLALTWIWYLLSQHSVEEARLHAELDEVLAGRVAGIEDIARLPYTRAVIEESLRLYPPLHTLAWRGAIDDDEVCGVKIPKGATVTIVPWVLHRHTKLWDRPAEFDPGRFSPEQGTARSRYAYLPFGAGPRVCIGASFVMTAISLILATIAQRYRLRLLADHPVEPQGLTALKPRYGMKMTLEKRR